MTPILLSTAYFPPIEYMSLFLKENDVYMESHEHFQKQSFRNRMQLLAANGTQSLSIPVQHHAPKMSIKEVKIDYATDWQRQHWKTITSAYNNSPFLVYFQDYFYPFYEKKIDYLFDFNGELLMLILSLLKVEKKINFTSFYYQKEDSSFLDYRSVIHPKRNSKIDYPFKIKSPYYQVFDTKFGFTPFLSVLDLICNKGNEAKNFLLASCVDE